MEKRFNDNQIEAIKWFEGPCLVLGTPGSGKTTVIVNRIKYLICEKNINPSKILVITFTRAAAESMQQRFISLMVSEDKKSGMEIAKKVRFGTFHSIFFWIIKTAYNYDSACILLEDEKRNIIKKIISGMRLEYENNEEILNSIIRQIGIINCDMIDINDYYSKDMPEENFRELFLRYNEEKRRLGKIDFDDMLNMCYDLLKERKDILDIIRSLYPYIMVDEFQDTNRIQYEILKLIAGPQNNLFVVGDDDQSIYAFRGARPEIMLGFEKEFENARIIALEVNYRCPAVITECSSRLISKNKKRYLKNLKSGNVGRGDIIIEFPNDVSNENSMIISRIREAVRNGYAYGDIAVLYRTNLNPRRLIYKLREFNIPFSIKDGIPNIFQHFAVATILDYILFAIGDNDRGRFLRFMNKPVRYISRNMLQDEYIDMTELIKKAGDKDYLRTNIRILNNQLKQIEKLTPFAAVNYIRKAIGYEKYLEEYADIRNIEFEEIEDILDEFTAIAKEFETYGEFFDYIDEFTAMLKEQSKKNVGRDSSENEVHLMTMHSSKGLEFRDVHIIDCVEEIIPHKKSSGEMNLEEERRMLYVGMTRAKENLYIYAPKTISQKQRKPSRFLTEQARNGGRK